MENNDGIYHYYYPISGSGAGVTINVLEYSSAYYYADNSSLYKSIKLSIETSEDTYYAIIDESGTTNDMADIVTTTLYLDYEVVADDESILYRHSTPVDYILELDYSANTIRFIEDN